MTVPNSIPRCVLDAANLPPIVTWGSSPEERGFDHRDRSRSRLRSRMRTSAPPRNGRSAYMGADAGNEDDGHYDRPGRSSVRARTGGLKICAPRRRWSRGHHVNENVNALVVPGSGLVKEQAEAEGLDKIFKAAGFEWREPGCSMCLAMNADKLAPEERCASTSNRKLRGSPGLQGPDPPRLSRHGGGSSGDRRALRRHPGVELTGVEGRGLIPPRLFSQGVQAYLNCFAQRSVVLPQGGKRGVNRPRCRR